MIDFFKLIRHMFIAPVLGAIAGFLTYLFAYDSSQLPASPIPTNDALSYATIVGLGVFGGYIWWYLDEILIKVDDEQQKSQQKS